MKTSRLRPFLTPILRLAASNSFYQGYTKRGNALSIDASAVGIRRLAISSTIIAFAALYGGAPLVHAAPKEWSENGHYYDKIDGSFTWATANAAANQSRFMGRVGHLVTVTSAAENLFLTNTYTANGLHWHWLGGVQPACSREPSGGWSWVSGEPFAFNNWARFEPNNAGGSENKIVFDHDTTTNGKSWNDAAAGSAMSGYIVEYEPDYEPEYEPVCGDSIFWRGDQANCDGTNQPLTGSFHNGNNWLNFLPPGASERAAFYEALPELLLSPLPKIQTFPHNIYFGDFGESRLNCGDSFTQGRPTTVGSVVIGSGSWDFNFTSFTSFTGNPPRNSAPLTVLGDTTIAYDPSPKPPLLVGGTYVTDAGFNPRLHIHTGTMNSASVTIGGTTGSEVWRGDLSSGELKIAWDAVLSSTSVTVAKGGVLSGNGRVIGPVHVLPGGKVAPGNSPGALTIQGNLTLATGGEVSLEVGGLVPGESYDQLVVEGATQLAGTVRLTFVNGFAPLVGDSFAFFGPNGFTSAGATVVSDPGVQIAVQGNQTLAVVAIPTPPAEYQQWRQSKFGNTTSREGEPRANLDGDSTDNFNEFLFNLNPVASDYRSLELGAGMAGIPVIGIVQGDSAKHVAFEFIRHKRFGPYLVQTSTDLQTWTTEAIPDLDSIVSVSEDYERVRIVEHLPMESGNPNANRRFYRISNQMDVSIGDPLTTVTGTVVGSGGAPAAGVSVTVSVDAGGFSSTTLTNAAGLFSVPCVPTLAGGLCLSGYQTGGGQTAYFIAGGITSVPGGVTATGTHTLIVNDSAFVFIPGGTFQMGDAFGEGGPNERPVHPVNVSAFFLQARETTKAEWDVVRTWALANGYTFDNLGLGKGTDHPVHSVSWYDVVKWCNARSQKEGLAPCYYTNVARATVYKTGRVDVTNDEVLWTANGYRLPTEAEWEKAARGGLDGKRFPWGDTITHSLANYSSNSSFAYDTSPTRGYHPLYLTGRLPYTSPVGSFAPNGYGLYDMTGNLWEWCWDRYGSTIYASAATNDPRGPSTGSGRVNRGGSWLNGAIGGRVAGRYWYLPSNRNDYDGFRPARGR